MGKEKNNISSNVELEIVAAYQAGEQIKDILARYGINDRHALYRILDKWKVDRQIMDAIELIRKTFGIEG